MPVSGSRRAVCRVAGDSHPSGFSCFSSAFRTEEKRLSKRSSTNFSNLPETGKLPRSILRHIACVRDVLAIANRRTRDQAMNLELLSRFLKKQKPSTNQDILSSRAGVSAGMVVVRRLEIRSRFAPMARYECYEKFWQLDRAGRSGHRPIRVADDSITLGLISSCVASAPVPPGVYSYLIKLNPCRLSKYRPRFHPKSKAADLGLTTTRRCDRIRRRNTKVIAFP